MSDRQVRSSEGDWVRRRLVYELKGSGHRGRPKETWKAVDIEVDLRRLGSGHRGRPKETWQWT